MMRGVIIAALRQAFPLIKSPPSEDICYATTNRQQAVRAVAPECDLVLVVGSRNSSNSVRLTEIAANVGTPARLIDDAGDIDPAWFTGAETVLITAGASAPEDLVAGVCRALLDRFGGTLETRELSDEDVEFGLPSTLKHLMRERGVDPESRRIRVQPPTITREAYGATPLTVRGGSALPPRPS
jgi:4-hydroxy-3-methylbut-2-enyl diphosphate reductase